MRLLKYSILLILQFALMSNIGCGKDSTASEPEDIPPDGTDGDVIAYCYQPLQDGIHQIYSINADGSGNRRLIVTATGLNHHDWSPDGQQIACVGYLGTNSSTWSIHVFDVDGTNLTRLTSQTGVWDTEPAWSPDGSQIAFTRIHPNENHREEIWIMNSDGSNPLYTGIEGLRPNGLRMAPLSSILRKAPVIMRYMPAVLMEQTHSN